MTGRLSRPTHVGRGLKFLWHRGRTVASGRPTHVGRGLKSRWTARLATFAKSPHACGAWIEVFSGKKRLCSCRGRPTHVGRGLKCVFNPLTPFIPSRPTHVGRGLKWIRHQWQLWLKLSPHACGAWIEVEWPRFAWPAKGRRPTHVGRGLKWIYLSCFVQLK